jgi:glycosyltransferase involved in cell wall biosynthesis
MKFLIVAYWHDPRFRKKAGGLIRMFELADNLIALGHEATMVLPKLGFPKTQTHARVVEIPFLDFPLLRPLCFHLLSTFYMLFACPGRIDRIYVRQMNSFLPLLVGRLFGIFSYFEIPNDPYIGYSLVGKSKRWLIKIIDRLCMILADRNVVLSDWSKKRLHAIGHVPLEQIMVFPSGTDTDLFRPMEKEASCRELNLDPSYYYIGFIGSFLVYQGIDTLIDAAPYVLEKIPNTRFLLVGDGPMRNAWESMVKEKGLHDHFIFTGHVPYRQVPVYIGAMDICVAPHHHNTNQASPVKLFDYMAAGRAIVASDIDVVREIIADSGCAILTPPNCPEALAENIITLINNETLRRELAGRGRLYTRKRYDRKILTSKRLTNPSFL